MGQATATQFLERLGRRLNLEPRAKAAILREIDAHLQDETLAWVQRGYSPLEAAHRAARALDTRSGVLAAVLVAGFLMSPARLKSKLEQG